jgi:hypothetical protein
MNPALSAKCSFTCAYENASNVFLIGGSRKVNCALQATPCRRFHPLLSLKFFDTAGDVLTDRHEQNFVFEAKATSGAFLANSPNVPFLWHADNADYIVPVPKEWNAQPLSLTLAVIGYIGPL